MTEQIDVEQPLQILWGYVEDGVSVPDASIVDQDGRVAQV